MGTRSEGNFVLSPPGMLTESQSAEVSIFMIDPFKREPWVKGKGMNKLLINVKQLSESTGLSVFTLYSWINQKRIPSGT